MLKFLFFITTSWVAFAAVSATADVTLQAALPESEHGGAVAEDSGATPAEPPGSCCTLPSRWAVALAPPSSRRVTIESAPTGEKVLIEGEPFAEYLTEGAGCQPAVWPITGPSGLAMTRQYPFGDRIPTETNDHPHHESLWFSHGGVNGHDFWVHPKEPGSAERPKIVHTGFRRREVSPDGEAVIQTTNDWRAGGDTVVTDLRTVAFGLVDDSAAAPRYIDFTIQLMASNGPATFADTKEGTFGVRVPDTMTVDARLGGSVVNSRGQTDHEAWGQPAEWVDYHGPLAKTSDSATAPRGGITILSHPESFRPICRWHCRAYGLLAANPFGAREFLPGEPSQGAVTIAAGDSLTLRYRVIFYAGGSTPSTIGGWYTQFAASSLDSYLAGE